MLQQTQVKTVIPYFEKFTKRYPTLTDLSKCKERQILKLWEGLGYYRRARNLLATVKILVREKKSKLPTTKEEIKKLPGVGEYTADALLGLVYDQPRIAVDGNVKIPDDCDIPVPFKDTKPRDVPARSKLADITVASLLSTVSIHLSTS